MRSLACALALLTTSSLALAADPAPAKLDAEWMGSAPDNTHELPAFEIKASASSELCEGKGDKRACHSASLLIDKDNATAWCEGARNDGTGESVTFEFKAPQQVAAVDVVPYYAKDMRRAMGNARPERVELQVDTQRFEVTFPDHALRVKQDNLPKGRGGEDEPCGDETCNTQDERISMGEHYRVTLPAPVKAQKVRLVLRSTYGGDKYLDTCMSSVKFYVR